MSGTGVIDWSKSVPGHLVKVKHRCGHVVDVGVPEALSAEQEKKDLASKRARYCPDCETRRAQKKRIDAAKKMAEGFEIDETAVRSG